MAIAAPLAGGLVRRVGDGRPLIRVGLLLAATGCLALAAWNSGRGSLLVATSMVAIGSVVGVTCASITVVERVPAEAAGSTMSVNTVARQLGAIIGAQVGATVLVLLTIPGTTIPSRAAYQVMFGVAALVAASVASLPEPASVGE